MSRERDMPAFPVNDGYEGAHGGQMSSRNQSYGLTKLEYTAIQLVVGKDKLLGGHPCATDAAVRSANALWDALEDNSEDK